MNGFNFEIIAFKMLHIILDMKTVALILVSNQTIETENNFVRIQNLSEL